MIDWNEGAVLGATAIASPQQHFNVRVSTNLGQQSTNQLRCQHIGVDGQDGATETQGIRHQHQLSLGLLVICVAGGILEICQHRLERTAGKLCMQPVVVEEDMLEKILEAARANKVKGQLTKLLRIED